MKKLLANLLVISSIGLLVLSSCKKSDTMVKATSGKAGALTVSASSLTLSKTDTTNNPIVTFTFTKANYGFSAVVTNTLQIDTVGDNWAKPAISVTFASNVATQSYTTAQLNTMALSQLKIVAGKAGEFNVRVVQTLGTAVTPVYSNVVTLSITPYSIVVPETFLYVVGAYQGWSLTARDSLVSKDGNIYTGIIDFTAGNNQFLILPDAQDYNNKYATNNTSTPTTTVTVGAPNNLVAPAVAGNYLITLNLSAGTITFALADYYSVIGADFTTVSANQWAVDYGMKYINDGSGTWTATVDFSNPGGGGFKIRQDDAWSTSWGTSATAGILTDASGGNINSVTTAGNYTVTFVMPATSFGSAPVTTAAYSITP
jgi:hypothetical protein